MQTSSHNRSDIKAVFLLGLFVLFSCWGLFWLDHETHHISDLFKAGNLVALLIYFVPTFLITYLLYLFFQTKRSEKKSLALSVSIGVPLSFALIIIAFYLRS